MADIKDTIGDIAGSLANAEPVTQISRGIAKVGEVASNAYGQAKDYVTKKLASPPPPGDIELYKEKPKKKLTKAAPVARSLSR